MKEVRYSTSSIGQIAYLLWKSVYPQELTFAPSTACLYFKKDIDYADLIDRYWRGTTIPVCELSECIVVAERIIRKREIKKEWFKSMKEAMIEVREDYLVPLLFN